MNTLQPANLSELQTALVQAHARGETISSIQLRALNHVVEHAPEDMTATVEAGLTLAEFQAHLARRGQWLPVDPPHPAELTIGELLSANAHGPRRFGYGTVRDYLIGLRVVLADGRVIKSGGKVVKNVAGYDLGKLFIGSRNALGVIVEATFKLRPLPEMERCVEAAFDSWEKVEPFLEAVAASELTPMILDLHNVATAFTAHSPLRSSDSAGLMVVLGFAGAAEDVEDQLAAAQRLGAGSPCALEYETSFWAEDRARPIRKMSVLPSKLVPTLQQLGDVQFVARAGNGLIWYRGGPEPFLADQPLQLLQRVKDAFDPNHILPELTA